MQLKDKNRIPRIIELIEKIWILNPDLRLCQLIENAVHHSDNCIYYIEDESLEQKLKEKYHV